MVISRITKQCLKQHNDRNRWVQVTYVGMTMRSEMTISNQMTKAHKMLDLNTSSRRLENYGTSMDTAALKTR